MKVEGGLLFVLICRRKLLKRRYYYLLFRTGTFTRSLQANERESRRGQVPSMTSAVCMIVRSMSESAVLPDRDLWFIYSWKSPRNVESAVVCYELGTSLNRVSILSSICSHGADLVIDSFQEYLLGTIQNRKFAS
jgi:hypothetical protein